MCKVAGITSGNLPSHTYYKSKEGESNGLGVGKTPPWVKGLMGYQFAYIELFQKENADLPSRITRKPEYFPSHKLYRSIFSFIVVETWIFAIYSWTTK